MEHDYRRKAHEIVESMRRKALRRTSENQAALVEIRGGGEDYNSRL